MSVCLSLIPEYFVSETAFKSGHEQTLAIGTCGFQLSVLVQLRCWCSERRLQEFFSNSQVLLCSLFIFIIKSDAIIDFAVYNSL